MTLGIAVWTVLILAFVGSVIGWWQAPHGIERDGWFVPVVVFGAFSLMPLMLIALQHITGGDS